MTNKENLQIAFIVALTDVFKDENDKELGTIPKIDLNTIRGNDLVLAMFYALQYVCNKCTGQECDPLEFIGILIRLIFQEQREQFLGASVEEDDD